MKKVLSFVAMVLGIAVISTAAFSGQNIFAYVAKAFTGGGATLLNTDAQGSLLESSGALATNNVSGVPVVIKASAGRLVTINVVTASGVGTAYDAATTGAAASTNTVFTIPATVGTYLIDWPMSSGIVIDPSSSVYAVKYN